MARDVRFDLTYDEALVVLSTIEDGVLYLAATLERLGTEEGAAAARQIGGKDLAAYIKHRHDRLEAARAKLSRSLGYEKKK